MNTYDPADWILYIHMALEMDASATLADSSHTYCRLPVGYANRSPRTCLRDDRSIPGTSSRSRLAR